ncbi:amino acid transporter [Tuber magnatum]|uniref:Amino acid transporter n=1 Tax=Tuber magnatum TaxID=42249 RepID=A0A317SK38_9PEZI|nr:amino acid transporter [Tuber magnatum]
MGVGAEKTARSPREADAEVVDRGADMRNFDDARLSGLGYKPELQRKFTLLSCLAVGFSISNSWFAVTGALTTGIGNGGSSIYMYGAILVALVHVCIGASLGELASAYPNAGGQYYWVIRLAPRRCRAFLSYLTGVTAWAGAMITGASVALVIGQGVVGIIILCRPEIVYEQWMGFVGYQIANILVFFLNCSNRFLPGLNKTSLYISLASFLTITLAVLIASPKKASADAVFGTYTNSSGWDNDVVAWILGLLGVNWGFSCLDACVHMAEEIPHPEKNIPKAIMGTVAIGFITSWVYSIAIFFSMQDILSVITTPTMVPILELFRQALRGNIPGAVFLEVLVVLTAIGCLMSIHTWQSRLLWSFARDRGFPFSSHLAIVAGAPYSVPLWSHLFSCFWIAVLGILYWVSTTAFFSLLTGGILMQYISYMIPVSLLLIRGRRISVPGPFYMGRWGWFANGVLVVWSLFTLVFYSFPLCFGCDSNYLQLRSRVLVRPGKEDF